MNFLSGNGSQIDDTTYKIEHIEQYVFT